MQTKRDANHKEIAGALRKAGVEFRDVSMHRGLGCDLLARHRDGYIVAIEIKRPGPPSSRKLTESEESLRVMFPEFFRVCQTIEEAFRACGFEGVVVVKEAKTT